MAAVAPSPPSTHFSISYLVSRIRSKRHPKQQNANPTSDSRPPLKLSPLPLVLPEHQRALSRLGWTTITFPPSPPPPNQTPTSPPIPTPGPHPIQLASQSLFTAARAFFALPDSEKQAYKSALKSEEGWSHIPGEKEFITLRTESSTPPLLLDPARAYWALIAAHLDSTLARISASLDLPYETPDSGLRKFIGPCGTLGTERTASMLRIFRYECGQEGVVAEPHADLGLLSVVVGDVAGLEVWDGTQFWGVEKLYERGEGTVLVGRMLERLSGFRYCAGGHRVVAYGNGEGGREGEEREGRSESEGDGKKYRYSIVFVLRAHEPVIVDSDELETEVTGKWAQPVKGVSAGAMYEGIRNQHFNINIDRKERAEQRRKLEEKGVIANE